MISTSIATSTAYTVRPRIWRFTLQCLLVLILPAQRNGQAELTRVVSYVPKGRECDSHLWTITYNHWRLKKSTNEQYGIRAWKSRAITSMIFVSSRSVWIFVIASASFGFCKQLSKNSKFQRTTSHTTDWQCRDTQHVISETIFPRNQLHWYW